MGLYSVFLFYFLWAPANWLDELLVISNAAFLLVCSLDFWVLTKIHIYVYVYICICMHTLYSMSMLMYHYACMHYIYICIWIKLIQLYSCMSFTKPHLFEVKIIAVLLIFCCVIIILFSSVTVSSSVSSSLYYSLLFFFFFWINVLLQNLSMTKERKKGKRSMWYLEDITRHMESRGVGFPTQHPFKLAAEGLKWLCLERP